MTCCLKSVDVVNVLDQPKVNALVEPREIAQFLTLPFEPMNQMCERAGMSERQIFLRTKAVIEYFGLPFDAEMPE